VAIETFPDIIRTLGNVTMDLAITRTLSIRAGDVGISDEDLLIHGQQASSITGLAVGPK